MLRRTQQVYPAKWNEESVQWNQRLEQTTEPAASTPAGTRLSQTKRQERRAERYAAAGVPRFVKMLAGETNLEVTLVGHSMGTIILNRVVRDSEINVANIVYLGAACSVEDFSHSVLPFMEQHRDTQFFNLSLHPVAEAGEWYPWLADLPPRGSLLIWIDNFLSNPVTEQERTMGRWRNLFRSDSTGEPIIRRLYAEGGADLQNRLHFQAFSVGFGDKLRKMKFQWNEDPLRRDALERCDNPLSHGELSEVPYWNPAFWWQPAIAGGKAHQAVSAAH